MKRAQGPFELARIPVAGGHGALGARLEGFTETIRRNTPSLGMCLRVQTSDKPGVNRQWRLVPS
jgi:hypothetical protein